QRGRASTRGRRAEDWRAWQAGLVLASQGFLGRAGRNRTGLKPDDLHHLDPVCDLLRPLVDHAVRDPAVRSAQPTRGWRRGTWHRSWRTNRQSDGSQADLDHTYLGRDFRARDVRLQCRISFHRKAVEADGDALLAFFATGLEG